MGTIQIDGSTPKLTIGNATAEDALIVFDGNAQDFYIGLDDSADDLVIGLGSAAGTTPAISINEDRDVTISDGAIDFDVASHDTSNGLKLGGTLVTATAAELNIMDGVTATAAEINLIDGGTARGTTAIADGDGVLINDAGTMRMTTVQTLATYIGGADPSSADGDSLGTASLEWSDLYLADGSFIYFGNDQEVTMQHNHNGGLTLKNGYGDTEGFGLHLQTAETTVVATNPIGFITFAAPNEASGTDAVVACAKIQAIAEGTFAADNNATSLQFMTGASEVATEKMRINSSGYVGIGVSSITDAALHVETSVDSVYALRLKHGDADNPIGIRQTYTGGAPDSSEDYFLVCEDTGATRMVIDSQGDIRNHDNAYGQVSDERIKQGIKDANSQWDDIKALRVRNFTRKDDVRQYGENAWEQIGLVAQEAETVSPKIVQECEPSIDDILSDDSFGTLVDDTDNPNEDGTFPKKVGEVNSKVKAIKYSVLYMKAIKALQEAQTRIETLETKVTALEG